MFTFIFPSLGYNDAVQLYLDDFIFTNILYNSSSINMMWGFSNNGLCYVDRSGNQACRHCIFDFSFFTLPFKKKKKKRPVTLFNVLKISL